MADANLASTLIATLVGGGAGYLSGRFGKFQDDRKRRKAVATALYAELRTLDAQLRQLVSLGSPVLAPMTPAVALMDALGADLVLLDAATIAPLLIARAVARDIELRQQAHRGITPTDPMFGILNESIERKARRALQEIAVAADGLVRNGAKRRDDGRPRQWERDVSPGLPPSPFPGDEP